MESRYILRGYSSKNFLAFLSLRARKSVSSSNSWKIAAAWIFFSRRANKDMARIMASKEYLSNVLKISQASLYWLSGFFSSNSFLGLPGPRLDLGVASSSTLSGDVIKLATNVCNVCRWTRFMKTVALWTRSVKSIYLDEPESRYMMIKMNQKMIWSLDELAYS